MSFGGLQLIPTYKAALDKGFLAYYLKTYVNRRMCYIHWSAGWRHTNFTDYHEVIEQMDDGVIKVAHNCAIAQDLNKHTWCRNSNSFALCVAGMKDATTNNLGPQVATPAQIDMLVLECVRACMALHAPVGNIMSHAEAGDNVDQGPRPPYSTPGATGDDALPYGPLTRSGPHACERWDFWVNINPKTKELKAKSRARPEGWLDFMDWLRGETIMRIQKSWVH